MTPQIIAIVVLVVLFIIALPVTWNAAIAKKSKEDAEKVKRRFQMLEYEIFSETTGGLIR